MSAAREVESRRQALVRMVEWEVQEAFLNLNEAHARFEVARANVVRAEESLNLVSLLFAGGSATVTRYLQRVTRTAPSR